MNRKTKRTYLKKLLSKQSKTNTPTKYQADRLRTNGTSYNNKKEYHEGLAKRLTRKWIKENLPYYYCTEEVA